MNKLPDTLLPYEHYGRSAECLTNYDLNNQIRRCVEMLNSNDLGMWKDHRYHFLLYSRDMSIELDRRVGIESTSTLTFEAAIDAMRTEAGHSKPIDRKLPPFIGDAELHKSHRVALISHHPGHYVPLLASHAK